MSLFRSRSDILQTIAGTLILAVAGVGSYYAVRHYQRVESENRRVAAANAAEQEKEAAAAEEARQRAAQPARGRPANTARQAASGEAGAPVAGTAAARPAGAMPAAASIPSQARRYAHKIHVEVEVIAEDSGVIAYSDGALLFDERLRRGSIRKVDAEKELRLIVDKPRAVQIKLNGELVQRADRGRGLILEAHYKDGRVSVNTMH